MEVEGWWMQLLQSSVVLCFRFPLIEISWFNYYFLWSAVMFFNMLMLWVWF
jgi:hypothetical protein